MNYPDLQSEFIKHYFSRDKKSFHQMLTNCLVIDKFSRKGRFYSLSKSCSFFLKETPLLNRKVVDQVVDLLFDLPFNDPLFVEKSYYILDQIVSFAKREGNLEILDYVRLNPDIQKHPNWSELGFKMLNTTHLEHDLNLSEFSIHLKHHMEYCKEYRSKCFGLWNSHKWKVVLWKNSDFEKISGL
jgi:hypothetical protein